MEILGALLVVAMVLVPSLTRLINSMAYRIKAQGKAEIIRARRGPQAAKGDKRPVSGRRAEGEGAGVHD
ncbi:hypothetical protein ACFVW1_21010 [Streptomyces olivochromogenes]|uniref:hypothetical protein n=1 Tax=Streptomyces olivochromogenes TaxID=1963 RepID=UPI0036D7868C